MAPEEMRFQFPVIRKRRLAESSPPAFEIARPKPAGQNVLPERLLSGDEVGRDGARTRPKD